MVLKAIGVNVHNKSVKPEKTPNKVTAQALKDVRHGKVNKAESVDELFKSI